MGEIKRKGLLIIKKISNNNLKKPLNKEKSRPDDFTSKQSMF